MGYGKRALQLLKDYFDGQFISLSETKDEKINSNIDAVDDEVSLRIWSSKNKAVCY